METKIDKTGHNKGKIFITCGIATALLVALGTYFIIAGLTRPVKIEKLELVAAYTSHTKDPEVKTEFSISEPIMLRLEYSRAGADLVVRYELKNEADLVLKSGELSTINQDGQEPSGQRYASIVNTASTRLAEGNYTIVLLRDGKTIKTIRFRVNA